MRTKVVVLLSLIMALIFAIPVTAGDAENECCKNNCITITQGIECTDKLSSCGFACQMSSMPTISTWFESGVTWCNACGRNALTTWFVREERFNCSLCGRNLQTVTTRSLFSQDCVHGR